MAFMLQNTLPKFWPHILYACAVIYYLVFQNKNWGMLSLDMMSVTLVPVAWHSEVVLSAHILNSNSGEFDFAFFLPGTLLHSPLQPAKGKPTEMQTGGSKDVPNWLVKSNAQQTYIYCSAACASIRKLMDWQAISSQRLLLQKYKSLWHFCKPGTGRVR